MRYHRQADGGRGGGRAGQQRPKAEALAAAIEHWRDSRQDGGGSIWRRCTTGCGGSMATTAACARCSGTGGGRIRRRPIRARRRVETPAGAQAQVDWAHFPAVIVGDEAVDLVALHMVLSWSRQEAIVWARSKDMLVLARLPHRLLRAAGRRAGDAAGGQREDGDRPRRRRLGHDQPDLPALCGADEVPRRCLRAAPAAAQGQGRAPGARPPRAPSIPTAGASATSARRPASASRRSPPACTSSAAFLASFKAEKPTSRRTTFQGQTTGPRGGAQHCCGMRSRRSWGAHALSAPTVCTNGQVPLTASTRDTPLGGAEGCGNDHAADGLQEDLPRSDGSIRPGVVHRPTKLTLTSEAGSAPAGPSSV